MSALVNIQMSSLREQAARAIRTGIVSGEITPGEIYSVPALATQLGVSATPVREAMLDLVSEGLVVPVRNRGFRVVSLTHHDLDEILALRQLIETPSMGDLAESHHAQAIAPFEAIAKKMPGYVRSGDLQAYLDADREFHLGLLGLLGNARLVDIVGMLRNQSRLFDMGKLVEEGALMESALEHAQIVAAVKSGNRKRTEELVNRHNVYRLREAYNAELASLADQPPGEQELKATEATESR